MKSSRDPEIQLLSDECVDRFMNGRLQVIQSRGGYRFSIDAVLLSEFVTVRKGDIIVDIGTGCGIIPMILLLTKPVKHVFGIEIQKGLASQAKRNSFLNGFGDVFDVIAGDIKSLPLPKHMADVVVCNPPYRRVRSGRMNPDPRKAIARHEIMASIDDVIGAARYLLRKKGRLAVIYPSVRLVDVMLSMRRFNLEPKRVQIHYPGLESEAELALVEASLDGRSGLKISPPLLGQGSWENR
ncbi:MAG: methyltransferase [Deltaproteobacteria bacterium]|nr:methyltransferase [Deltaproteobacteria bacterium]